jgi:hypothetical protein
MSDPFLVTATWNIGLKGGFGLIATIDLVFFAST